MKCIIPAIAQSPVGCFWDWENLPVPETCSAAIGYAAAFQEIAKQHGAVTVFKAYLQIDILHKRTRTDMMLFALESPTPITLVVATSDRDFSSSGTTYIPAPETTRAESYRTTGTRMSPAALSSALQHARRRQGPSDESEDEDSEGMSTKTDGGEDGESKVGRDSGDEDDDCDASEEAQQGSVEKQKSDSDGLEDSLATGQKRGFVELDTDEEENESESDEDGWIAAKMDWIDCILLGSMHTTRDDMVVEMKLDGLVATAGWPQQWRCCGSGGVL
ncbi:hypothetical protein BKA70DRAFT_1463988 [Coprinopsis sp. MPI-PUGE-AT-0042]|nr:hypothetical protein BKA70DRAFT_1463988 [Coprinopsis sp. MPI-PUGE-AT-0042]